VAQRFKYEAVNGAAILAESDIQENGRATFVIVGSSSVARSGRDSHCAHISKYRIAKRPIKVRLRSQNFLHIIGQEACNRHA
jgi:hypothetical protein